MNGTRASLIGTETMWRFETENEVLTYKKTHGGFPPYKRVIPAEGLLTTHIKVDAQEFASAVKRLCPVDKEEEHAMRVREEGGFLILTSEKSADRVRAVVDGPFSGVKLNMKLLLPFLVQTTGSIDFSLSEVVDFRTDVLRFLLMPMKTDEQLCAGPHRAREVPPAVRRDSTGAAQRRVSGRRAH